MKIKQLIATIETTIAQFETSDSSNSQVIKTATDTLQRTVGMLKEIEGTLYYHLADAVEAKEIAETGDEIGSWLLDPEAWQSTIDNIQQFVDSPTNR